MNTGRAIFQRIAARDDDDLAAILQCGLGKHTFTLAHAQDKPVSNHLHVHKSVNTPLAEPTNQPTHQHTHCQLFPESILEGMTVHPESAGVQLLALKALLTLVSNNSTSTDQSTTQQNGSIQAQLLAMQGVDLIASTLRNHMQEYVTEPLHTRLHNGPMVVVTAHAASAPANLCCAVIAWSTLGAASSTA